MLRIDFFIQNMEGGGAERVILTILNNLDKNKFNSNLILIENRGVYLKKLKKDIKIISFEQIFKNRKINFFINFIKAIKMLKKNKEIIFTQYHPGKLLSFLIPIFFKERKIIYRETNIPQEIKKINKNSVRILDKLFYKYGIKNFDKIIVQSLDMKEMLLQQNKFIKDKIILINNPVDTNFINNEMKNVKKINNKDILKLISIGRLNKQKGYDLLINTLGKINNKNFILNILGEGPERKNLEKLIRLNKLQDNIFLLGFKENPYKYIANSDFYISSSRFEGFPNTVLEANACGIPVIANDYKGGINEIIEEGVNGKIIDITNKNQFEKVLYDKYDSKKIKNKIENKYGVNIIVKKYEKLFLTIFTKG